MSFFPVIVGISICTMVEIAAKSPYVYCATGFFALSALSSDLLFIRFCLMNGFLFLVLAGWSGQSADGWFPPGTAPFVDGTIDIPLIINTCLFALNFAICLRLMDDERPKGTLTNEEQAMYRFFHCRCGMSRLEFDEVRKHGNFLELEGNQQVPQVDSTLYLVLEGVVHCQSKFREDQVEHQTIIKRSGQFFDIRLFNVFSLPIGFDSIEFHAQTVVRTRLFAWSIRGLMAMRDCHSPSLHSFWEYMVLRCLAATAVRHHLRDTDRLYDAWLVPEDPDWLQGAPSRDFGKPQLPEGTCGHVLRQLGQIAGTIGRIIPPKGIRHPPPCGVVRRNPRQDSIAWTALAKAIPRDFTFLARSRHRSDETAAISPQTTVELSRPGTDEWVREETKTNLSTTDLEC